MYIKLFKSHIQQLKKGETPQPERRQHNNLTVKLIKKQVDLLDELVLKTFDSKSHVTAAGKRKTIWHLNIW